MNTLLQLRDSGVYKDGDALRLNLGCGEKKLSGFINIDFPQEDHSVFDVEPDFYGEIKDLALPYASVDKINLSNVFEHFTRVEALGLLVRWHLWLKKGGTLRITVPDAFACSKVMTDAMTPYKLSVCMARHLMGDQCDSWGLHREVWWPARLVNTLYTFGFTIVSVEETQWEDYPYIQEVTVVGKKVKERSLTEQLEAGKRLLEDSLLTDHDGVCLAAEFDAGWEKKTYEVWYNQFENVVLNLGG